MLISSAFAIGLWNAVSTRTQSTEKKTPSEYATTDATCQKYSRSSWRSSDWSSSNSSASTFRRCSASSARLMSGSSWYSCSFTDLPTRCSGDGRMMRRQTRPATSPPSSTWAVHPS